MKEFQLYTEFHELHKRVDDITDANNQIALFDNKLNIRLRAFENLINQSWLLRKILGVKKFDVELARVKEEEALARSEKLKFETIVQQSQKDLRKKQIEEAKAEKVQIKKDDKRERDLKKELKHHDEK